MNRRSIVFVACASVVGFLAFSGSEPEAFAQKKGKSRPLTTAQMMAGLVKPQFMALKEGLDAESPTADDWKALATAAALLNESGHLMLDDGRSPDEAWTTGAKQMQTASVAVLEKLAAEDAAGAKAAFEGVMLSCKTCHSVHKVKQQP